MFRYAIQYKMCLYFQFHWLQTTIVTLRRTSARRITKTLDYLKKVTDREKCHTEIDPTYSVDGSEWIGGDKIYT